MRKLLLFFVIAASAMSAQGQFRYQNYELGAPIPFPATDSSAQKIVLLKKKMVEFGFERGNFIQIDLIHVAEYLHTADAVEKNSRKYLPYSPNSLVIEPQARVISPDGSVEYFDETKVQESVDSATGNHYRYFSFEEMEPGSIVEYLYVIKTQPRFDGKQEYIQGSSPILRYEFDLYCPADISFEFKSYNTGSEVTEDSETSETNHYFLKFDSIPALVAEYQAPLDNLYSQFAYKLDSYGNDSPYISYAKASTSVYQQLSSKLSKREIRSLRRLLKQSGALDGQTADDKIYSLEYYLKTHIRVTASLSGVSSDIADMINYKFANEIGLVHLYYHALAMLGIDAEYVLTCDRTIYPLDPQFQAYHFLNHYLIYIPQSDKYLDPSEFAYRYGLVPSEFTDTYGLFIHEKKVGDFATGIGKIRYINALPYNQTFSNINISIGLNVELDDATVEVTSATNGYYCVYIQPYLTVVSPFQRQELIDNEVKRILPGSEVQNLTVKNDSGPQSGRLPLEIAFSLSQTGMVAKSGDTYLVKIGETIGKQLELDEKTNRTLPLHSDHKRLYNRTIKFKIPNGYSVANLGELAIDASYGKSGSPAVLFHSEARIDGDILTVVIQEFYDQVRFSSDEYDQYRKVINSAADFNKVVLVLEHNN